ncbi:MAG: lipoyl(octanoyl) transferase LipB, partial [Bacteroidota bacterium]
QGFTFHKINRGGDITYHGPGQLVAYPILDLEEFFTDVHRYVRCLEEVVIRTCADFGITAHRDEGYTGVWLPGDPTRRQPKRKICAIGVHLSRWTTLHGFAFNVRPNLTHFGNIVPCGIADADRAVTSLSVEVGRPVELDEVKPFVQQHFAEVFDFSYAEPTTVS